MDLWVLSWVRWIWVTFIVEETTGRNLACLRNERMTMRLVCSRGKRLLKEGRAIRDGGLVSHRAL